MAHWLLKSEPETFGIDHLALKETEHWDGVRNYMARNNLRAMKLGEQAFFYHSSCQPPGIAGICEVVREAYPDHTAWDPDSKYFEPRSTPDRPLWFMPDVRFVERFGELITLEELRRTAGLEGMPLLQRGQRLSVQPVSDDHWDLIMKMRQRPPSEASGAP